MKKIKVIVYFMLIFIYIGCSSGGGIVGHQIDKSNESSNTDTNTSTSQDNVQIVDTSNMYNPTLTIKDNNGNDTNQLNILGTETKNIAIDAEALNNNKIISFNTTPTAPTCAKITIDPYDINKTIVNPNITFEGVKDKECSFTFYVTVEDSYGLTSTKSLNVIVTKLTDTTKPTINTPSIKLDSSSTINIKKGEVKTINFTVLDSNNSNIATKNTILTYNDKKAVAIIKESSILNTKINILGVDVGTTTIKINALDETTSLSTNKDITVNVTQSDNNNMQPKIEIIDESGHIMSTLKLKKDDTYNISINLEDKNIDGKITKFETNPKTSNIYADISINKPDLNESFTISSITFKGKAKGTFNFITMATNNYGLTSTKIINISVIEDNNDTQTSTSNEQIKDDNKTSVTDTTTTEDNNTSVQPVFDSNNAVLDESACTTNSDFSNTLENKDINIDTKDYTHGIEIKTYNTKPVKVYYKDNNVSNESNTTYSFKKDSNGTKIYKLVYNKSWTTNSNNTVYVEYTNKEGDKLPSCDKIVLNKDGINELTFKKVYR